MAPASSRKSDPRDFVTFFLNVRRLTKTAKIVSFRIIKGTIAAYSPWTASGSLTTRSSRALEAAGLISGDPPQDNTGNAC